MDALALAIVTALALMANCASVGMSIANRRFGLAGFAVAGAILCVIGLVGQA